MTLDFKLQAFEDRKINNHIQILSVIAYLSNVIIFFLQVKDWRVFFSFTVRCGWFKPDERNGPLLLGAPWKSRPSKKKLFLRHIQFSHFSRKFLMQIFLFRIVNYVTIYLRNLSQIYYHAVFIAQSRLFLSNLRVT